MASDNFNRSNADPLDGSWAKPSGFGALKIVSNEVVVSTTSTDSAAYSTVSSVAASYCKVNAVAGGRNGGPAVHLTTTDGGYCLLNYDAGNFYIFRLPEFTQIAFTTGTYQIGDILGLRRVGSTLVASVNGTDVLTSSVDNTYVAGATGLFLFDGLVLDDWNDGVTAIVKARTLNVGPGVSPNRRQQFTASRRAIVSLATITGTSSTTNANDTSQGTGVGFIAKAALKQPGPGVGPFSNGQFIQALRSSSAVQIAVTGTLARTNANDTSAAAGTTTILGTLARTNANDTSAAAGTTTVLGTLARTNANDTSAASGATSVIGSLATTNANDTSAASGSVGGGVSGTSATTNANDVLAASGTTTVIGTLARTNANDSATATGWAGIVSGSLAYTNANDSSAASGSGGLATATSGGWFPNYRTKTKKEKEDERKELGIEVPKPPVAPAPAPIKALGRVPKSKLAEAPKTNDSEARRLKRRREEEELMML